MKLQPPGSGSVPQPARRPNAFHGPPGYLRFLPKLRGTPDNQRLAQEAAEHAYRVCAEALGPRGADRELTAFLKPTVGRHAHKARIWLRDFAEERLWESPQKEIYSHMVEHDYYGDFPRDFTRELLKQVPGTSVKERVDSFRGFLGNEAFQHHDTKVRAYQTIKALHRKGWSWLQASDKVIGLATAVPPGEHGQYWNGSHLVRDFLPQRLYETERGRRYLKLLELGYHRDSPAQMMELIGLKVAGTNSKQRLQAVSALTEANRPVWFEEPEKVVLAYRSWSRRVEGGEDPERALEQTRQLSLRLKHQLPEDAAPSFEALARLKGPIPEPAWQQVLDTWGAFTDLSEPLLGLHYHDQPQARQVHQELMKQLPDQKLEVSEQYGRLLEGGLSPEHAFTRVLRGAVGDDELGPSPEIHYEPGYLVIGEHGLPVNS